jgi:hypothetical protein
MLFSLLSVNAYADQLDRDCASLVKQGAEQKAEYGSISSDLNDTIMVVEHIITIRSAVQSSVFKSRLRKVINIKPEDVWSLHLPRNEEVVWNLNHSYTYIHDVIEDLGVTPILNLQSAPNFPSPLVQLFEDYKQYKNMKE